MKYAATCCKNTFNKKSDINVPIYKMTALGGNI